MTTSFIATVFNEEKNIGRLLDSLLFQSKKPDEVVIVDAMSTDKTFEICQSYEDPFKKNKIEYKLVRKKCNRSIGRNIGVKKAKGDIILFSDAGNILSKNWLENIISPFKNNDIEVVSGFYKGLAKSVFEKCQIPYVLVQKDKVDKNNFLPSTRSMAIRKKIFVKFGGFKPTLNFSEDYEFAKKLKNSDIKMYFQRKAVVFWIPRSNLFEAFCMFLNIAKGDVEANVIRDKALLIFVRYFLFLYLVFLFILYKFTIGYFFTGFFICIYIAYSIFKNRRYINNRLAYILFPIVQISSDIAVMTGTLVGCIKKLSPIQIGYYISRNKFLFTIVIIYILIQTYFLRWGAPNVTHPFPYHMDEWHQFNAVRATFAYGTPNVEGAANGTMLHFLITGLSLIPPTLLGWIDPAHVAINDFNMRARIFDLLRISTIIYGALSIVTIYNISKYVNASPRLTVVLFASSPLFVILGGYYKYDISLIFWILISILFLLKFSLESTGRNFVIASIPIALSISIKVSAIPLFLAYFISFFIFTKKKDIWYLAMGGIIFITTLLLFGMPDTLFGSGNILDYLYNNIIETPSTGLRLILNLDPFLYLGFIHIPIVLGFSLWFSFLAVFALVVYKYFFRNFKINFNSNKCLGMLVILFIVFALSLLPLKMSAAGNRILVLLPFSVLITSIILTTFQKNKRLLFYSAAIVIIVSQFFQSFAWLMIKYSPPPQKKASEWILSNVPKGEVIGLENIPIYQSVPDIAQKEFYYAESGVGGENQYKYSILNAGLKNYPNYVVVSNDVVSSRSYVDSEKERLVSNIKAYGYRKIQSFHPNLTLFNTFGTDFDFYISNIVTIPVEISIFIK